MFGLLPIEGNWFLRFEKRFKEFFLKPHPFFIRIFRTTLSILRKSPRPSLPLKRAPPLTPTHSPTGEREETALLGARNRFALRLADHQRYLARPLVGGPSKVSPDCAGWDRLDAIGASKVSPDCAGWDRLTATCLRSADGLAATCLRPTEGLGDHLGMSGASKVSPDCLSAGAFNVPIKAVSIQWLVKHYDDIEEEPGLIVMDEAHHALAKTYKEMWERFPKAKFLGLTATPCRLNGKGFTDLFDVLVQSWSVPEFISKGRLATYDFVSIKSDGVTQRLIDSLQKRGADGDYQNKEMDMLLNKKPSIERLYQSLEEYGKDRKGIVYAINIRHANAIAEFYREHGIAAVAIDSKTPSSLRKELIERFKASSFSSSNHQPSILHKDLSNHPDKSSKITPSLFTIKEGSTSHPDPLTLRGEGGNRSSLSLGTASL